MIEKLLWLSLPAWCLADVFTEFNWEKFSSTALVAFMVVLYTMKFLPQQRKEEREFTEKARVDFLKALSEQRIDFTAERAYDRELKSKLVTAYEKIADATEKHIVKAEIVWRKQGFLPNRDDT